MYIKRRNPFHMFGMGADTPPTNTGIVPPPGTTPGVMSPGGAPIRPIYVLSDPASSPVLPPAGTPVAMMPPTPAPAESSSISTYVLWGGAAVVAYYLLFRKR